MNNTTGTKGHLLDTARTLFAERGFRGTTVRAIAAHAHANIAAVTYHFGSKEKLYHAVLERVTAPIRERLAKTVTAPGNALDRVESFLKATFAFVEENPDVPRLVFQQLVTGDPLPPPAKKTMQLNLERIVSFIEEGQSEGSIRPGNARHLALSIAGQPFLLAIYRGALREAMRIDQDDPPTRRQLVEDVVSFIRSGLATEVPHRGDLS